METILWILGIHWLLGIVFSLGLVFYGSYTGNDVTMLLGGEFLRIILVTGFLSSLPIIFVFFRETINMIRENKAYLAALLNIPHREEIDEAWLDIFDEQYYNQLKYNVKEGGWLDSILFSRNVDYGKLERGEKVDNRTSFYYFRPKSLSHLNK
jgi:hypothetical protein